MIVLEQLSAKSLYHLQIKHGYHRLDSIMQSNHS